jgi:hypothetical protein
MSRKMRGVLCMLSFALAGCAAARPQPKFVESGFLTDYSLLAPSNDPDRAQLLYRNPKADFSRYSKVLFQRVTIWVAKDKEGEEIASEDFQRLADDMYYTIREALGRDYSFVTEPGPGVLRIHLGLTWVSSAEEQDDVFLSVASPEPPAADESPLTSPAEAFVNNANVEVELTDAETGEVLFEGVDPWTRQTPLKRGGVKTWKEVHEALAFWAGRIQTRFAEARRGEF